jgi:hypothetical protein
VSNTNILRPEFIRLPKPRTNCPHTGLSRTDLYNLTVPCKANNFNPSVPAKNRRKPGNLRGVWVIPYGALIAHINSWDTPGLKTA